ncbi:NAD(P)H-binding protein [Salinibaculum rarum]|uniref:NAD(P)H-binding protein n=1 Tax=Salinibaculum rarum TaxID=3058903 RepID=UPI00265EE7F0|nr:NAD(P)H-binding protein [Salinibaculum sp. KK48]
MDVLVTGATGFVGGRLVPALRAAGHDVRVLVRDETGYDASDEVTVFEGDLLEPGSFDAALDGADAAYYLVHSMKAGEDFEERDRNAATNFADAASAAGVDRVVYLGGLGEEGEELSRHLKSRREVETVLGEGDYDLTTLRAAIIIGHGSASFAMVKQLASRLPVMVTPRWVQNECQPVAIGDVIGYLVGLLDHPETAGETYEIGGPDVLTYGEIIQETARAMGRRPPTIIPVPVLTPRLSSYWVGLVTDVDPEVARPLIDGLRNAVVVRDDSIRDHLDFELTPFVAAVEHALAVKRGEREPVTTAVEQTGGQA